MTAFNVWQPQGNVVANPVAGPAGNPSVIFDTNPVVLLGHTNVFKMWAGNSVDTNLYYFESLDGLTSWTAYSGNPIASTSGNAYVPTVYKVGSTYYLYTSGTGSAGSPIGVYTSTDGVTFTSQGTQITVGAGGAWDSSGVFQLNLVDILSGTWYAYYSGYNGIKFGLGLATSTDGIHWTKSGSNPIFAGPIGNCCFLKASGVYYMYAAIFSSVSAFHNNYRLGRWSSSSPSGPWTPLMSNGIAVPTYYLATATELGNVSGGYPSNGVNDQRMCVANGNIYLYYTLTAPNGQELKINAALASGITPAQLVATYEGVLNVPFTGLPELNFSTIGSDDFQRADANPIGGNWTQESSTGSFSANALVSHTMQGTSLANVNSISYWNASSFNNDQWSKVTISQIANASSAIYASLRLSTAGQQTFYRIGWTGSALGGSGEVDIQKDVAGSFSTLSSITGVTLNVGDTIGAVVVGTAIYSYINDNLFSVVSDSSLTSGPVGAETVPNTALSSAAISAWSGGNFQAAPAISFSISGQAAPGALISYSGTASGSVTADGSGNYTLASLAPGTYTITPSQAGVVFTPTSITEIYAGSNITGVNFGFTNSRGYAMFALPTLLQPGQNGYFFGSYSANKPNPNFEVTATSGNGTTATINVVQREGFTPAVGDLITVTGTTQASGGFNVSGVALSAVSLDPVTGIGTLSYLCTASASSAPDFGNADVLNGEAAATLVNGASKSVAVQTAAGQNDNGKNIAWTVSYKAGAVAPMAVTASLQGALVDQDSEYTTIASTTVTDSANLVISNVTQRFYRVLISNLSGGSSKIISKITI